MSVCKKEKKLREAFADARKKGEMFFGSGELLLEKLIEAPHHVEVQILADGFGNTLHLYDRECSVQRRNQKIVEEAPSPFITPETRAALCNAAVRAAEAVGYVNAGTVEMIVDGDQNFYFLEMNTRLQVEHPITELICGLDIVEWQLKIAAGEHLSLKQEDIKPSGHAIEARLCAEDPNKRFFPAPGTLETVMWPSGEGIRVDAGVEAGSTITPYYDSMFAKLCAHGATREEAIKRLRAALEDTQLEGTTTNLELHKRIMDDEVFQGGTYTTAYLKDVLGLKS
jgi:acetyl-CoA carboxylase biotin carboxylase subunit